MLDSLDTPLGQLTLVAVAYAVLVAGGALAVTLARRARPALLDHAAWILELLMAVRVVAGLGSMLGGRRPDEPSAHVGYLVAAVCVLPIAMRSIDEDRGPWSSGVVAVAALAVAVIGWRLAATWGHGG